MTVEARYGPTVYSYARPYKTDTFFVRIADGKIASVVGSLCYILTWTPGVAVVSASSEGSTMWLTSTFLMPASGVYMWGWAVAILENAQTGMTWQTLFTNLLEVRVVVFYQIPKLFCLPPLSEYSRKALPCLRNTSYESYELLETLRLTFFFFLIAGRRIRRRRERRFFRGRRSFHRARELFRVRRFGVGD